VTPIDPSSEASLIPRIGNVVARVMKNPALSAKVTASTDLVNEIGLDSLQMIDFLLGLEDEFGVEVDFDSLDMQHLTSVEALCHFVHALRPAAAPGDTLPASPLHRTADEGA
jgi:acyl carrier protein